MVTEKCFKNSECNNLSTSINYNSEIDEFYDYLSFCIDTIVLESAETAFIVTGDFNPNRNNFKAKRL